MEGFLKGGDGLQLGKKAPFLLKQLAHFNILRHPDQKKKKPYTLKIEFSVKYHHCWLSIIHHIFLSLFLFIVFILKNKERSLCQ